MGYQEKIADDLSALYVDWKKVPGKRAPEPDEYFKLFATFYAMRRLKTLDGFDPVEVEWIYREIFEWMADNAYPQFLVEVAGEAQPDWAKWMEAAKVADHTKGLAVKLLDALDKAEMIWFSMPDYCRPDPESLEKAVGFVCENPQLFQAAKDWAQDVLSCIREDLPPDLRLTVVKFEQILDG